MKNVKLSTKLLIAGLLIGILSSGIVAFMSIKTAHDALEASHMEQIETLSGLKKEQIEGFYKDLISGVQSLSATLDIELLYKDLKHYHDSMAIQGTGKFVVDDPGYRAIETKYAKHISNVVKSNGFYDLFIICAKHGHVMYSFAKESDLGENLAHGKLKTSHLAEAWDGAIKSKGLYITDLEAYEPSNGAPAQFIAYPLNDANGAQVAVVAIQVPDPLINKIMTNRLGLGETGESYLVGRDKIMRSDSRFQENAVLKTEVHSETLLKALDGKKELRL